MKGAAGVPIRNFDPSIAKFLKIMLQYAKLNLLPSERYLSLLVRIVTSVFYWLGTELPRRTESKIGI